MPTFRPVLVAVAAASLLAAAPAGRAPDDLPVAEPESVGMSAARLAVIDRVIEAGIGAGGFPGAAVVVGRHGSIVWERGYGTLSARSRVAVDPRRTRFDLASVTKVVSTATAAMLLVDDGRLTLDDPVGRWLPEFRAGAKARVTVRQLLQHRAGLPAGRELARARTPAEARALILRTALVREPGSAFEYSDLGPIVLGAVVERIAGEPLDRFVRRRVYAPLGMRGTSYRPVVGTRDTTLARTEAWLPVGQVHDRTAHALGDVAGHAGLFSTASDLAVFAQFMLARGTHAGTRLVADSTVAEFTRRGGQDRQALGWSTCAGGASCGRWLGPTAFGHDGFTGTSLWIDPERDLFVIVLTNWVAGDAEGRVAPVAVLHDVRSDVADLAALAVMDGDTLAMPVRMRSDARIGW